MPRFGPSIIVPMSYEGTLRIFIDQLKVLFPLRFIILGWFFLCMVGPNRSTSSVYYDLFCMLSSLNLYVTL